VVSDVGLPDGDGCELLRRLRAVEHARLAKPAPAIALTGLANRDDERWVRAAGYAYYVVKPIDPFALVGVIREAAGRVAA
jgi:ATP-binding cassette subfamily B protein